MNVDVGTLDKKIKIVKMDEETGKIEVIRECWASVRHQTGKEIITRETEFPIQISRFLIRYSQTEITQDMTILYNGGEYGVTYSNNYNDSNEFIEILAERRRSNECQPEL